MNLSEKSFKEQNLPAKEANFLNSMNDNHTRKTSVKFRVESEKTKSEVISSFKRKSRKSRFKVERVDEYEDGDGEQKTLENFPDVEHYLHSSDKQEQKLQDELEHVFEDDAFNGHRHGEGQHGKRITRKVVKFGWVKGVFVRCLLNIFGVMLFLRLSWVVGQAGIGLAVLIVILSAVVTTITALSMSAICTNGEVKGGGAYFLISRSLGPEFGGAIGIIFSLANSVAAAMYVVGFAETIRDILKDHNCLMFDEVNDVRIIGILTTSIISVVAVAGLSWETRAQVVLLIILIVSLLACMLGTFIPPTVDEKEKGFVGYQAQVFVENLKSDFRDGHSFFSVFGVFFPAATGILAGANISGDLKDAQSAIPKGTLLAILVTTVVYLSLSFMVGSSVLRDAAGPIQTSIHYFINESLFANSSQFLLTSDEQSAGEHSTESPNITSILRKSFFQCKFSQCKYGIQNDMQVMHLVSMFGPITIAGIISATLSSALASIISAPKIFQAVCKDRIFPGIHIFAKGYGANDDPRRTCLLSFFVTLACICIGDLNIIAPLISNFFLMSYALVNYSCVDASLAKSPGWRPSFRYYSAWLSLLGSILCIAVMFVINWSTALVTIFLVAILYFYVHYRNPDINWGSSTQAHVYRSALHHTQKLTLVTEHVKNFRPQILALTGFPSERPELVEFCESITRNISLMICGHVILHDPETKLKSNYLYTRAAQIFLSKIRSKSFYCGISSPNLRFGVQALLQATGVGKLKTNTLMLGFKSNWRTSNPEDVEEYFNIIFDAFELEFSVGILRLAEGLHVIPIKEGHSKGEIIDPIEPSPTVELHVNSNLEEDKLSQVVSSDVNKGQEITNQGVIFKLNDGLYGKRLKHKQTRFIDVWWLFDDGGMTLLVPYLMSTKKVWSDCRLRIYVAGSKLRAPENNQRRIEEFHLLIDAWKLKPENGETKDHFPWKITEGELESLRKKTYRHIRLHELLAEHSADSSFIVMTLPRSSHEKKESPALYMAWIEILSRELPPLLFIRGNQENVLTFYS